MNKAEHGCVRCVFFAVNTSDTLGGWLWALVRFAVHRWSGQCRRMKAALDAGGRE
jgi:hypothetical protein